MPDPLEYLEAMASSACAAALVTLVLGWACRRAGLVGENWIGLLALLTGAIVGYGVLQLRPAWPPTSALDRLLTIVLPMAAAIEAAAASKRVPRWVARLLRLGLAAATSRILLHGSVYLTVAANSWTWWQASGILIAGSLLLAAIWELLGWLVARQPSAAVPLVLALAIQSAGLAVMLAGYIKGGEAAFPLAASLAGTSIAAGLSKRRAGLQGTVGVGVVSLFGLLFIGLFFGRLTTIGALTILFAPLLCWATRLPMLRDRPAWLTGAITLLLVSIPLAVVIALAKLDFDRHMAPLL